MLRKLSDWNCKEKSNTAKWVKMQSLWNNVRSIKKYTKHSSSTPLHLVYFFMERTLVARTFYLVCPVPTLVGKGLADLPKSWGGEQVPPRS